MLAGPENKDSINIKALLEEADRDGILSKTLAELSIDDLFQFAQKNTSAVGGFTTQIRARIREVIVLKLRLNDNLSFTEIAKHPLVKMNEPGVRNCYYRMLNRFIDPADVAEHIRRANAKLDVVGDLALNLYDPKKPVASTMALNVVIGAESRRAKLLGLDAPKQVKVAIDQANPLTFLKSAQPLDVTQLKAIQQLDPIIKPIEAAKIDEESIISESDPTYRESVKDDDSRIVEDFNANHRIIEAENNERVKVRQATFKAA